MSNLYIESKENRLVISGNTVKKMKSRHKIFLKRKFRAEISDEKVVIENIYEIDNLISDLCDFLNKNNISYSFSDALSQEIERQLEEEQSFIEFSEKAKNIWDNNFDIADFDSFQYAIKVKMKRILYPLQLLSAYHLAFSQNAANFSVPGAGKTSIVYGAFSYLSSDYAQTNKKVDKILMIGPLSSFGPWEMEYEECFKKKVDSKRISGVSMNAKRKKEYFFSNNTSEITLMSYQSLINQKENVEFFLRNNDVMLVLDEAHKIKNTKGGLIADVILDLAKYSKSRVILTGTPAPNGYQDLYNLFKFLWPSKQIIRYNLFQLEEMNNQQLVNQELINDISPYFVRISKSDLNLPLKNEYSPILVNMDSEQKEIYHIIEKKAMNVLEEDNTNSFVANLKRAKLIRMMQAASNPLLLQKPIDSGYFEEPEMGYINEVDQELILRIKDYSNRKIPPKFYEALKLIKEIINRGEKVVVWAIYVDSVKKFGAFLRDNNIESRLLYGETPIDNEKSLKEDIDTREKIIREFHCSFSDFKVVIANPFAVAESISLHKACHNAIYLEKNFDAARFVQSKDRIHRYGLTDDVITNYYYLVTKNSIEETIHQRLLEKETRMLQVMESKEIPLFLNLKDEFENDVKAVINDYANRT